MYMQNIRPTSDHYILVKYYWWQRIPIFNGEVPFFSRLSLYCKRSKKKSYILEKYSLFSYGKDSSVKIKRNWKGMIDIFY